MKDKKVPDELRVLHIRDATELVARHVSEMTPEVFVQDEVLISACAYQVAIIGEALMSLSSVFREKYPDLPYDQAKGMRNIIMHEYFEVSLSVLWKTCIQSLPLLHQQVLEIIESEEIKTDKP